MLACSSIGSRRSKVLISTSKSRLSQRVRLYRGAERRVLACSEGVAGVGERDIKLRRHDGDREVEAMTR